MNVLFPMCLKLVKTCKKQILDILFKEIMCFDFKAPQKDAIIIIIT